MGINGSMGRMLDVETDFFTNNTTLAETDTSPVIEVGAGRINADLVIDVSACEAATNELYQFVLQGSNDDFTTFVPLAVIDLGHNSVIQGANVDRTTGRWIVPFHNLAPIAAGGAPVVLEKLRLQVVGTGTIATGIVFSAFATQRL